MKKVVESKDSDQGTVSEPKLSLYWRLRNKYWAPIDVWLHWFVYRNFPSFLRKSNTLKKAEVELAILMETTPDAVLRDFIPEIKRLVNKYGNSGQSGGSAEYYAQAISRAVHDLCLQKIICPVTGHESEWMEVDVDLGAKAVLQNKRCAGLFQEDFGKPYYVDAITFVSQEGMAFSGSVQLKNGKTISSSQFIKDYPFIPKTFEVNVISTEWEDQSEKKKKKGGGWWTHKVRNDKDLRPVMDYYDFKAV